MKPTQAQIEAEPNGLANLQAILDDQPFANSTLTVAAIRLILENRGGFMPDEAVMWFREWQAQPITAAAEANTNPELCDGCGEPLGDAFCVKCCSNHPATIERCAQYHDKQEQLMIEAQDWVAVEWHRDCAAAIRAMKEEGRHD